MTHRFHPLHGREFTFVQRKTCWGVERIDYIDDEGVLRYMPAGWTSVAAEDPFVKVAAGRSPFRAEDLLALADLLDGLKARNGDGNGAAPVKEITPLL